MTEQVFVDTDKQLIVALSPERLSYNPVGSAGWNCKVDDIRWTTSTVEPRGLREVRLHDAAGRAVSVPEFEQIERFYLALLKQLASRRFFDPIRAQLPTRVDLLERVLWMGGQSGGGDGDWQALQAEEGGIVVASRGGLMISPPPGASIERVPWTEWAGVAQRAPSDYSPHGGTRFYRTDSWLELTLGELRPELEEAMERLSAQSCQERPRYEPPGVRCPDPEVAMEFSWELEAAREDGLFEEGEQVLACAYGLGRQRGALAPSPNAEPTRLVGALSALNRTAVRPTRRTIVMLTNRRLLTTERETPGDGLAAHTSLPMQRAPRPRLLEDGLVLEDLELQTDRAFPDMARRFVECYRRRVRESIQDPFSPDVEAAGGAFG